MQERTLLWDAMLQITSAGRSWPWGPLGMVLQEVEGNDQGGRNTGPDQKIDRAETGVFSMHISNGDFF